MARKWGLSYPSSATRSALSEACNQRVLSTCPSQVVAEANPVPVKKLGYELVRAATLSVNDWEAVATGLKVDINDRKVRKACSVIQQCLDNTQKHVCVSECQCGPSHVLKKKETMHTICRRSLITYAPQYDETQIAALQTVPAVPSWKLPSLLQPPVSLGDDIVTCLSSTSKTVRRMAVEALSHLLVSAAVLQTVVEHQGVCVCVCVCAVSGCV